jgi:hypothetical protein
MAKKLEIIMCKEVQGYPKVYVSSKIDYDTIILADKEVRDLLFSKLLRDMEIKLDAVRVEPTEVKFINLETQLPNDNETISDI